MVLSFFFFNDTATTEIYTLSLHDALPICQRMDGWPLQTVCGSAGLMPCVPAAPHRFASLAGNQVRRPRSSPDRKSTRLNSSHLVISYAVFCLKKKKESLSPPSSTASALP